MFISRRKVVQGLVGVSGSLPLALKRSMPGLSPIARGTYGHTPDGRKRPTYKDIGYKVFLIDFQFTETEPMTMKNASPDEYVAAAQEMSADGMMVYAITNTGFALYNSKYAPKFTHIADDFLDRYLAGCKTHNLKATLYQSTCWQRIVDIVHPDWAIIRADGTVDSSDTTRFGFMGRTNNLCINSPARDLFLNQAREIGSRFDFDAWFLDIFWHVVPAGQACYNKHCMAKWKSRTGIDLPNPFPPELGNEYRAFIADSLKEMYLEIKEQVKATGHDVPFTTNPSFFPQPDFLIHESNPLGSDYYEPSISTRTYFARADGIEVQALPHFNNNYLDYVNSPPAKVRWQSATIAAYNQSAMWGQQANIDGSLDRATIRLGKIAFEVADRILPKVRGTVPYAEVALLMSDEDNQLRPDREANLGQGINRDFDGANRLLMDIHWPYEVIDAVHLDLLDLSRYKLLIIPDIHYMTDNHLQRILGYVARGGNVFVSNQVGAFDLQGKPRDSPSLGLVKIKEKRAVERSFIKPAFPIDDERLLARDVFIVEPSGNQKVMGHWINLSARKKEGFPLVDVAYPMETSDEAVFVNGREGKGHFTYTGYPIFEEYHNQGLPVIADTFKALVADYFKPEIEVVTASVVETVYNSAGSEVRICLVNGITARPTSASGLAEAFESSHGYTNIVEVVPIFNAKIRISGRTVSRATSLSGERLNLGREMGATVVMLPKLEQYDVVTLEFA